MKIMFMKINQWYPNPFFSFFFPYLVNMVNIKILNTIFTHLAIPNIYQMYVFLFIPYLLRCEFQYISLRRVGTPFKVTHLGVLWYLNRSGSQLHLKLLNVCLRKPYSNYKWQNLYKVNLE